MKIGNVRMIIALLIVMLMPLNVFAKNELIQPDLVDEEQWLQISGETEHGFEYLTVTVVRPDRTITADTQPEVYNESVKYVEQTLSDSDGKFSVRFRMDSGDEEGDYTVFIKYEDGTAYDNGIYTHYTLGAVQSAFAVINNPTSTPEKVKEVCEAYAGMFGLDLTYYNTLKESEKMTLIRSLVAFRNENDSKQYADMEQLREGFENAAFMQKFSVASSVEIEEILTENEEKFRLADDPLYTKYLSKLSHTDYLGVCVRLANENELYTYQDVYRACIENMLMQTVSAGISWYDTKDACLDAQEFMGIDASEIESLSDPSDAYKLINGKQIQSKTAFQKAIDDACYDAKKSQKTTSSKGGSGGGGGGGIPIIGTDSGLVQSPDNSTEQSGNTQGATTHIFADVSTEAPWAENAIVALYRMGIVQGRGDGVFDPNALVTREEFTKLAVGILGQAQSDDMPAFMDADPNQWYMPYLMSAYSYGLIEGISDTEFGIGANITRQDSVTILNRLALKLGLTFEGNCTFADNSDISDYAIDAVGGLAQAGIINGMGDNTFAPQSSTTRAEAAQMLYNLLKYADLI